MNLAWNLALKMARTRAILPPTALLLVLLLGGCASLKSVSLSQVPLDRNQPIEAEASSWAIFGIYFSNSFVDDAIEGLKDKCPRGKVSGVYTKYDGRSYVLWTTRTVKATAYCVAPGVRS